MFSRLVFFKLDIVITVIVSMNCRVEDVPRDVETPMKAESALN
jgi:hypothetical protein